MEGKERGYIKLWRKMTEWEWYTDSNTKAVFLHLIILANHEDKRWQGMVIKRGQLVTSIGHLASELDLGNQVVRTALKRLEESKNISKKSTNRFTIITVENYTLYQSREEIANNQITIKQQTDNKQITTTKEAKNYKNYKKYIFDGKKPYGRFENVYLSGEERKKLADTFQASNKLIDAVSNWFAENDTTSKNHYATCLKFADRGGYPKKRQPQKTQAPIRRTPEQEQEIDKARAEAIKKLERMQK